MTHPFRKGIRYRFQVAHLRLIGICAALRAMTPAGDARAAERLERSNPTTVAMLAQDVFSGRDRSLTARAIRRGLRPRTAAVLRAAIDEVTA